jgi:hypothetical protein
MAVLVEVAPGERRPRMEGHLPRPQHQEPEEMGQQELAVGQRSQQQVRLLSGQRAQQELVGVVQAARGNLAAVRLTVLMVVQAVLVANGPRRARGEAAVVQPVLTRAMMSAALEDFMVAEGVAQTPVLLRQTAVQGGKALLL